MAKEKFLLVNLAEDQTKQLAETITSPTSRKILEYLADQHAPESKIATDLDIPISTVHYHLQKLTQAQLVSIKGFNYSPKGKEVKYYELANKYIIIAPKKVTGLKNKLRSLLPAGLVVVGTGFIIEVARRLQPQQLEVAQRSAQVTIAPLVAEEAAFAADAAIESAPVITQNMSLLSPITVGILVGAAIMAISLIGYWVLKKKLTK